MGRKPQKTKSKRQTRFLLSKGSTLSPTQKSKLKSELSSGKVKVRSKSRRKK